MQTLLLLSASVFVTLTCPPGTGTPNTKGVFKFEIYPPLAWCYNSSELTVGLDMLPKLAANKDAALKNTTDEIKAAIKASLVEYDYGSISFTVELKDYTPTNIKKDLSKTCSDNMTISHAYYGSTVYYKCAIRNSTTSFNTAYFDDNILPGKQLYDNQWDALAVKVQKKLQAKGVVFDSPLDHDGH